MEEHKYLPLWTKYRPAIIKMMKMAKEEQQQQDYQLSEHEFTDIGERIISRYAFNIEIKLGKVTNDISKTAVARDLVKAIEGSNFAKKLMEDSSYKINMGKDFNIKVNLISIVKDNAS